MKKLLIVLAVTMLCLNVSAQIANTQHDLSSSSTATWNDPLLESTNITEICVFCHTPHQPDGVTEVPLWNHTMSTAGAYGTYDDTVSPTMDATDVTEVFGSGTTSELCMSCHDGTVAVGNLYKTPQDGTPDFGAGTGFILATNDAYVGDDLTNDHPVNFTFDATLFGNDPGLNDPAGVAIQALLIGDMVQCSSCHDPHDDTNGAFLVMDNGGSALCLTCHDK